MYVCVCVQVLSVSTVEQRGIVELWSSMSDFFVKMEQTGVFDERRHTQRILQMWQHVNSALMDRYEVNMSSRHTTPSFLFRFRRSDRVKEHLEEVEVSVQDEKSTPGMAADRLIALYESV